MPIVQKWLRAVLDYLVCAYIILILAALPFYCPEGYTYIATRKNALFDRCSAAIAKVLIPTLLLYGIISFIRCCQTEKRLLTKENRKKRLGRSWSKVTAVDFFALWYGAALIVSYLCTDYGTEALKGAVGWNMGFYTQMVLVCSYFLISKLWKPRKVLFGILFPVSAAVFLLGYLNRFSIYPFGLEPAGSGFISTIGNINWYCGYVTTVFFSGVVLLWQEGGHSDVQRAMQSEKQGLVPGARAAGAYEKSGREKRRKVMLIFYVFLGFSTLVTQGSASGILALGVVMLTMFYLSAGDGIRMLGFMRLLLLLSAACLFTEALRIMAPELLNYRDSIMDLLTSGALPIIMTLLSCTFFGWTARLLKQGAYNGKSVQIVAFIIVTAVSLILAALVGLLTANTLYPGSIGKWSEYDFFTFSDSWASSRGATWKCGLRVFMEQDIGHKLTGVGPDAMAAYIYSDGSCKLMAMAEDNFGLVRLTNAHNEWLTVMADVGLLGLAGFGGMMTAAIGRLLKRGKRSPIICACGMCLLAYTINNIFSFQQIMNTPGAFVLLGIGMAFDREMKSI